MPPATEGIVRAPLDERVMPQPVWKPASKVVGPTSLLKENRPPGGTTTPLRRDAASAMLCCFSGTEPANAVRPSLTSSRIPSWDASEPRTAGWATTSGSRSEEHTSELQSRGHLVCRLLLEKKKKHKPQHH